MTKQKLPKAVVWIAESVNEYAAYIDAGESVPHHTPSSPMYWLAGLANDTRNAWISPTLAALLTDSAVAHLRSFGIVVAR